MRMIIRSVVSKCGDEDRTFQSYLDRSARNNSQLVYNNATHHSNHGTCNKKICYQGTGKPNLFIGMVRLEENWRENNDSHSA